MLPGFRFLFAATMLSMSLLIFGLGAAALLRAAHESFASNTSWRGAPEVPFAQRPDTTMPVLAALRVEPNSFDRANDSPAVTPAPVDQPAPTTEAPRNEPARSEPARNDQVAALRPVETPPLEPAKTAETPVLAPDNPPATEAVSAAPATASAPAAVADEHKTAVASLDATPAKTEPVKVEPFRSEPTRSEPARSDVIAALVAPDVTPASQPQADSATAAADAAPATEAADSVASTKIATLGGPPVDITEDTSIPLRTVKLPRARPDQAAIKKRVQARRAMQRRRLALRARLVLQQQQANPFGQPQTFPPAPAAVPR